MKSNKILNFASLSEKGVIRNSILNLKVWKSFLIMIKKLLFAIVFGSTSINAQEKTIDTVHIYDNQLHHAEKFQLVYRLDKENLHKNTTNLSDVLRFQSPIYIKENGRGGVSSPSFRGTTAQQTAFVWNGINVNSITLGQGDINHLSFQSADQIDIISGGGSVRYGSGAIGGTVNLNNQLKFNQGFKGDFFSEFGSFNTLATALKTSYSNEKLNTSFFINFLESENEYKVPEKRFINRNGQYRNQAINFNIAYKIAPNHQLSWVTQFQDGIQHFPIFSETQTKTKYATNSQKSLLNWEFKNHKIINAFRVGYLQDEFNYFSDIQNPKTSGANAKIHLIKEDFDFKISEQWALNLISEFRNETLQSHNSGVGNPSRTIFSFASLLKYQPLKQWFLEAGMKKDWVQNTDTPILFSLGNVYQFSDFYLMKINLSKNFRYPTFNDLYWQPGGKLNLKSETSYQAEWLNELKFRNFKLTLSPYYIRIFDMIRWLPTGKGYWAPFNTNNVQSFGIETLLEYQKTFNQHKIKSNLGYTYTNSKDLSNNYHLMYVPFHKAFGSVDYANPYFGIYVQGMFNGLTYTTSDEKLSSALQPYFVGNTGIYTQYKNLKIGFKVNNFTNQIYQTMEYYYLPMRNYAINLNINF